MATDTRPKRVAVIGGGVSGLCCTKALLENSQSISVHLFEKNAEVGGRVRTRVTADGFLIDEGFQILIKSYPEVRRQLHLPLLGLRSFGQGAVLAGLSGSASRSPEFLTFANPLTHPSYLLRVLFPLVLSRWGLWAVLQDVWRLASGLIVPSWLRYWHSGYAAMRERYALELDPASLPPKGPVPARAITTAELLHNRLGLRSRFLHEFIEPFFRAVYVSPVVQQHAGVFEFVLRALAVPGSASLPRAGLGAVAVQLLGAIKAQSEQAVSSDSPRLHRFVLRAGTRVARLAKSPVDGRFRVLADGCDSGDEGFDAVVVAADWPVARKLLVDLAATPDSESLEMKSSMDSVQTFCRAPVRATATETWYFALPRQELPVADRFIILNASPLVGPQHFKSSSAVSPRPSLGEPLQDSGASSDGGLLSERGEFRISNIAFPSVIQPSYAPPGWHLCAATVIQCPIHADDKVCESDDFPPETWVREQLCTLLQLQPEHIKTGVSGACSWRLLHRARVRFHQPAQSGQSLHDRLAFARTLTRELEPNGVFVCGDWLSAPTLDGAMLSGRLAGERVGMWLGE